MTVDTWLAALAVLTHWCPMCETAVAPEWMLIPNAAELAAYHVHGGARHAVRPLPCTHATSPDPPARETISVQNSRLVSSSPDD